MVYPFLMLTEVAIILTAHDDNKGRDFIDYEETEKRAFKYYIPYKFITLIIYQIVIVQDYFRHINFLKNLNVYEKEEYAKFKSKSKRYYFCINLIFFIYYIFYFINYILIRVHYIKFYSEYNDEIKIAGAAKDDINKNVDIYNNSTNAELNIENYRNNL